MFQAYHKSVNICYKMKYDLKPILNNKIFPNKEYLKDLEILNSKSKLTLCHF